MTTKRVIDHKYLPAKLPFQLTAIAYLLMDKFHANGIVWGVVGTLFAILWIGAISVITKQESVHPSKLSNIQ